MWLSGILILLLSFRRWEQVRLRGIILICKAKASDHICIHHMADVLESLLKRVSHQLGSTFGRLVKEGERLKNEKSFLKKSNWLTFNVALPRE